MVYLVARKERRVSKLWWYKLEIRRERIKNHVTMTWNWPYSCTKSTKRLLFPQAQGEKRMFLKVFPWHNIFKILVSVELKDKTLLATYISYSPILQIMKPPISLAVFSNIYLTVYKTKIFIWAIHHFPEAEHLSPEDPNIFSLETTKSWLLHHWVVRRYLIEWINHHLVTQCL